MKIVNWNIEWMNDFFEPGTSTAKLRQRVENRERPVADVAALCQKIAAVIEAMEPDVLIVQEGPSAIGEMELFLDRFLPGFLAFGGIDGQAQKVYVLVREGGAVQLPSMDNALSTILAELWESDVDGDLALKAYKFTRRPVAVRGEAGGAPITVIGAHFKSNFVNHGQGLWLDPATRLDYVRQALVNRRRISSEGMRLRDCLDSILDLDPAARMVVGGDLNDGPGRDYFELRYLTHNVTDLVLGSTFYPRKIFRHGLIDTVPADRLFTVVFDDFVDGVPNRELLLDHILLSPALAPMLTSGAVESEAMAQAGAVFGDSDRATRASDHLPVSVTIAL